MEDPSLQVGTAGLVVSVTVILGMGGSRVMAHGLEQLGQGRLGKEECR